MAIDNLPPLVGGEGLTGLVGFLPAPLSPKPWAMMTVAVCFATAGMVIAEGGILPIGVVSASGKF